VCAVISSGAHASKNFMPMPYRVATVLLAISLALHAQAPAGLQRPEPAKAGFVVEAGTRIPLSMINSVSTKSASVGDRVYLETVFPTVVNGRIVIPAGSYVEGTVTEVKRAGRIKGRSEMYVRFDSLTLPNGVTRNFRGRIGTLDARAAENLDRDEGKLKGAGNKAGDARTVAETAGAGASVGAIAGAAAGRPGTGVLAGGAGGAAAGLVAVLLTRGPDAMLAKGTTVEMVLDRALQFDETELVAGPTPRSPSHNDSDAAR
jgi:hypothetical protein